MCSVIAAQIYIPPRKNKGFPFSHPQQYLLYFDFFIIIILTGIKYYHIVILIHSSEMISDVEHFYRCLLKNVYPGLFSIYQSCYLGFFY
jgi:hypothetical protein